MITDEIIRELTLEKQKAIKDIDKNLREEFYKTKGNREQRRISAKANKKKRRRK